MVTACDQLWSLSVTAPRVAVGLDSGLDSGHDSVSSGEFTIEGPCHTDLYGHTYSQSDECVYIYVYIYMCIYLYLYVYMFTQG